MKVNRTKGYGAEVVLHGDVYDEACNHAYELAEKYGYTFIHPFDDETVAVITAAIAAVRGEGYPFQIKRIVRVKQ